MHGDLQVDVRHKLVPQRLLVGGRGQEALLASERQHGQRHAARVFVECVLPMWEEFIGVYPSVAIGFLLDERGNRGQACGMLRAQAVHGLYALPQVMRVVQHDLVRKHAQTCPHAQGCQVVGEARHDLSVQVLQAGRESLAAL